MSKSSGNPAKKWTLLKWVNNKNVREALAQRPDEKVYKCNCGDEMCHGWTLGRYEITTRKE